MYVCNFAVISHVDSTLKFCARIQEQFVTHDFIFTIIRLFHFRFLILTWKKIEWENYLKWFTIGLKTFLLKEDLANLPVAHSRIRK